MVASLEVADDTFNSETPILNVSENLTTDTQNRPNIEDNNLPGLLAFTGQEHVVPIDTDLLCTVDINVVAPLVDIDATSYSTVSILNDIANFTTDVQSVQDGLHSRPIIFLSTIISQFIYYLIYVARVPLSK